MPKRSLEALEDYPDTTLIKSTLKDTWSRFHEWNLEDSRKTIESLRAPVARRRNHTLLDDNYPANSTTKLNESAEDTVSVFQFDEEGAIVTVSRTTFQTVRVQGLPESLITPAYESGPPISRNIMVGDDPSTLPFLPFADDAGFNWADYAGQHDAQCAWHYPRYMIDPGEAFMVVQTVRKLVERHGLTAEEIESAGVLPAPLLDSNWRRGILYQDSLVDWFQKFESGIAERNAILLPRALLAVNRLNAATDVNLGLSLFCNGLNCLVSCCTTHFDESPAPLATAPTVTSSQILDNTVQPCDRQCFLFYPPCLPTNWTTEELETLQVVVRFSPDTSPCDLAVICNKPCFEASRWRRKMIDDKDVGQRLPLQQQRITRSSSLIFRDDDFKEYTRNPPCSHDGPCTEQTGCACFLNNAHCEHACRCDRSCPRRWKGCKCHRAGQGRNVCGTIACPCFKVRRECDPELCNRCKARDSNSTRCKNVSIQRGSKKTVEVKEGAWGLGCFLLEPVATSEFIIEYVGELIFDLTTKSRDDVSSHRKRNYVFTLDESLSIDSAYAGNEARYINHDTQRVNCAAFVKLVNGEHRIGIYATRPLEAGTELFLDYGPEFFKAGVGQNYENVSPAKLQDAVVHQ